MGGAGTTWTKTSFALVPLASDTAYGSAERRFAEVRGKQIGRNSIALNTALQVECGPTIRTGQSACQRLVRRRTPKVVFNATSAMRSDHDEVDLFFEYYFF